MDTLESTWPTHEVGRSPPRLDGPDKVTGRARYLDDLTFPGQLWGRTVRSPLPHARIRRIVFDPGFDWSGITTATAADIPGENVVELIEDDQPCLADGVVRHREEPVALLACDDRERLEEALRHVRLELEPLPAVLDPLAATRAFRTFRLEHAPGMLAGAFARADRIIEGTYRVGHQEHMYIEPNAVCAVPREDGGLTLYGSMQCPFYIHRALERLLGVGPERIAVIQTVTGGGFGGKEEYPSMIACHAALLARKAGRPVKIVYRRDEDVAATTKRHPAIVRHRTAVALDGTLLGGEVDIVFDGGAYCTLSPVVASRGLLHAGGAYRWPAFRLDCRVVATNTPPNGAFRGFGAPQTLFAVEMHLERIARELGLDPLEVRRRNVVQVGDTLPCGQVLRHSVGARAVLEAAAERSDYARKRIEYARDPGRRRRGIGISLALHGAGFTGAGEEKLASCAGVELTPRGCRILTISTDIGQGTITIFHQMAADALGVPLDCVEMGPPDTSQMPDSGPTVASRTCMVVGGTIARAAREVARVLAGYAAGLHGAAPEQVRCRGGAFYEGERRLATFSEVAGRYLRERGPLRVIHRYAHPPGVAWDEEAYRGDAYPVYAYAATAVEIEVDLDTGEVRVSNAVAAADVGRAIHPVLAQGQVEGGVVQALGYALLEEVVMKDGGVQNTRMQSYIIPTSLDAPPIESVLVEEPYPHGPFGAKGLAELPMDGPAPAAAAAVLHASGAFIPELPVSPERILRALEVAR